MTSGESIRPVLRSIHLTAQMVSARKSGQTFAEAVDSIANLNFVYIPISGLLFCLVLVLHAQIFPIPHSLAYK